MGDRPTWTTACPDWKERIVDGRDLVALEPLFPAAAQEALRVFDQLVVADVAGSPRMGEIARPWLRRFVAALFGAYDVETGRRLIREALLLISKKNGKSTDAAAIIMTLLVLNWRNSAEMLILAPTIEVAGNSFKPAWDMVRADEELSDLLHVQAHTRTITHRITKAEMKIIAAESDAVSGKKAGIVLVDELWLFGKRADAASMLAEATGGLASRPEGMVIYTSTHSDEPPAGVWKEKLEYARKVRDGEIDDPAFLPVLYEFPDHMIEDKSFQHRKNWYITNPNMGFSVDEEYIDREVRKARATSIEALNIVFAKHLNVQIGLRMRADRWVGADYWEAAGNKALTLDELLRRSDKVTVGMDAGGLDDLFGVAVLGREAGTGRLLHWGRAWADRKVLNRINEQAPAYLDFEKEGDLVLASSMIEVNRQLVQLLKRIYDTGLLAGIGVDRARFDDMYSALEEARFDMDLLNRVPQSYELMGAINAVAFALSDGRFEHGGTPMMAWCLGNARYEVMRTHFLISKQTSGAGKIDPLMALFDAHYMMTRAPQPRGRRSAAYTNPVMVV